MKAINYWMAQGVRIPGWLLQRPEVGLDSKIVYGLLLDDASHWPDVCLQNKTPLPYPSPPLHSKDFARLLSWSGERVSQALQTLVDYNLLSIESDVVSESAQRRFTLPSHEWAEAIFYDVEDGDVSFDEEPEK